MAEMRMNDFVSQLAAAAGSNLMSVVLYGSAVTGDYVPELSDTNLLCVLRDTSFSALRKIAPSVEAWAKNKHRSPLILGFDELRRSADVFSIELLDMRQNYKVVHGEDVLGGLSIPTQFHRVQLEYELREKTILLRQGLIAAGGNQQHMWELLLRSLPGFATLFRHALLEFGEPAPSSKREAAEKLAARSGCDLKGFLELLDIREHKRDPRVSDVDDVFARYLQGIEQVTAAVDTMLDSAGRGASKG